MWQQSRRLSQSAVRVALEAHAREASQSRATADVARPSRRCVTRVAGTDIHTLARQLGNSAQMIEQYYSKLTATLAAERLA